jgi:hypothetical protein
LRHLISYFRRYWTTTGRPGYLLSIFFLAAVLVYANYHWGWNARWVKGRFFPALLLYALPYWLAWGLQYLFGGRPDFHRHKGWWGIVLAAPVLLALQSTLHSPSLTKAYLLRSCVLIAPIALFWYAFDRTKRPLYGLQRPDTWSYYPYLVLLMIPLLFWAAGQPDFIAVYPRAKGLSGLSAGLFESSYGLDLFSMEFFFRGWLILGLARMCKAQSILPAALFYLTVHFGKPMEECVSSLFGGILLGVIALESRSIYVGVLLHLCLAWGLEVLAFFH